MNLFHALLDTRKKRELIYTMVVLALIIIEGGMNGIFLWRVWWIDRLENLYNLTDLARLGMIGRMVLAFFEAATMSASGIAWSLLSHISVRFISIIILGFPLLFNRQKNRLLQTTRNLFAVLWNISAISWIFAAIVIAMNVRYTTYDTVLHQLQWLSSILLASQLLVAAIALVAFIVDGYFLLVNMQYRAVEMVEEVTIEFDVPNE